MKTYGIALFLLLMLFSYSSLFLMHVHPPHSILFITIETLRPDHLSVYGYPYPTTPFLQSLSSQATVFNRVYATASWTPPTLATFLFGGSPIHHHVIDWGATPSSQAIQTAWPKYLRSRYGYRTLFFSNHPGLKTMEEFICPLFDTCLIFSKPFLEADEFLKKVRTSIQNERKFSSRLFIWVHIFDPHEPFLPPEPWMNHWIENTAIHSPPSPVCPPTLELFGTGCIPSYVTFSWPSYFQIDKIRALYDASIAFTDAHLRKFLTPNWTTNWIVSISADHGEIMTHPETSLHPILYFSHGTYLYEELVHIPWLLILPPEYNHLHGTSIDALVSQMDIPPTVMSFAHVTTPPAWRGRSVFDDKMRVRTRKSVVAWELRAHWAMIISPPSWIWVQLDDTFMKKGKTWELVPLNTNPIERRVRSLLFEFKDIPFTFSSFSPEEKQILRSLGYIQLSPCCASPPE